MAKVAAAMAKWIAALLAMFAIFDAWISPLHRKPVYPI